MQKQVPKDSQLAFILCHFWYCAILSLFPVFLVAQKSNYTHSYYSTPEGLSNREIRATTTDYLGYKWVATSQGINRFDGYSFLKFENKANSRYRIFGNDPKQLFFLDSMHLAVLHRSASFFVDMIDVQRLTSDTLRLGALLPQNSISAVQSTGKGTFVILSRKADTLYLHTCSPQGLLKKLKTWPSVRLEDKTRADRLQLSKGVFFIYDAAMRSVVRIESTLPGPKTIYTFVGAPQLFQATDEALYFSEKGKQALVKYRIVEDKKEVVNTTGLATPDLGWTSIWIDTKGNLILAKGTLNYTDRLVLLEKGASAYKDLQEILDIEDKIIHVAGADFSTGIELCTHNGLFLFNRNPSLFTQSLEEEIEFGKWGKVMRSMVGDGAGNIYCAEEGGYWHKIKSGTGELLEVLTPKDERGKPFEVFSSSTNLLFQDGVLYGISRTESGGRLHAYTVSSKKWAHWDYPGPGCFTRRMLALGQDKIILFNLVLKSRGVSVLIFNKKTGAFDSFPNSPLFNKKTVQTAVQKTENIFWVGTTKDLLEVDVAQKTVKQIHYGDAQQYPETQVINALYFDEKKGLLYIGTEAGLLVWNEAEQNLTTTYTVETSGISNDIIAAILPAGDDELLISSWFGLSLLHVKSKETHNFYQKNGLTNDEFNRLSAYKDDEGFYYFGGVNGVNIFRAEDLHTTTVRLPVQFSKFFRYDDKVGEEIIERGNFSNKKRVVIGADDLYFGFDFMYPDFTNPKFNRFETWLEGWEKTWREPSLNHSIRYDRLPKGDYIFHVRPQGQPELENKIFIELQTHFYQAGWFKFLCLFTLFAFSFLALNHIKNKERKEKAEKIRIENKFKELELEALRAQLNPHFIFNALTSIQFFIQTNEAVLAEEYLSKFAKLMRLFLELSRKKFSSLQEELELLHLYTDLESVRFEDKFDTVFEIDPKLSLETTKVPSNLLQPFVENAINHGLINRKEKGTLWIKVSRDSAAKNLICTIQDNGIGREAAKKIKLRTKSEHISRGMQLIESRIQTLYNHNHYAIQMSIDDLKSDNSQACGTAVQIIIPL